MGSSAPDLDPRVSSRAQALQLGPKEHVHHAAVRSVHLPGSPLSPQEAPLDFTPAWRIS